MFSIFKKTLSGLKKTRDKINNTFAALSGKSFLDENDIDEIEEILIQADLGWEMVDIIIDKLYTRTVPKTNSTDGSGSLFPVFPIMESNFIFLRFS